MLRQPVASIAEAPGDDRDPIYDVTSAGPEERGEGFRHAVAYVFAVAIDGNWTAENVVRGKGLETQEAARIVCVYAMPSGQVGSLLGMNCPSTDNWCRRVAFSLWSATYLAVLAESE